jgi:hypothetical protein
MVAVRLTSFEAFTAPLDYHQNAALFLQHITSELSQRATDVITQVSKKDGTYGTQISQAIEDITKRLQGESQTHHDAVTYLSSHFKFLVTNEANFSSGFTPPLVPTLPTNVPAWLAIRPMPINSCFDLLKQVLNTYDHVIYGADRKIREFEDLVWTLINDPASLNVHVGWSGNVFADAAATVVNDGAQVTGVDEVIQLAADFMREHENEIRGAIDAVRDGVEFVCLPLVDGQVLQNLIDYVQGVHDAYHQYVHGQFKPTTQAFVANYQPPQGQTSYQDSLSSFGQMQEVTAGAFGALLSHLNNLQGLNEDVTLGQIGAGGDVGECLVSFGLLVAFPPDVPATGPIITWRGFDLGAILTRIGATLARIAEIFATIGRLLLPFTPWIVLTIIAIGAAGIGTEEIIRLATGKGDNSVTRPKDAVEEWAKALGIKLGSNMTAAEKKLMCQFMSNAMSALQGMINQWARVKDPTDELMEQLREALDKWYLPFNIPKKTKDLLKAIQTLLQDMKNEFKTYQKTNPYDDCRQHRD